jgi:CxxC motif-containing protein
MEKRELICIGCPLGCQLKVEIEDNNVTSVEGNTCKRGEIYAQKECTNPTRIVTSSVEVIDGVIPVVSVKTEKDIPKESIAKCMKQLKGIKIKAPIKIGDIIVENIAGTNINVIATKNVQARG